MQNSVLHHEICEKCVWSENGFYNSHCAHCPNCVYGKDTKDYFMTKETAEMLKSLRGVKDD